MSSGPAAAERQILHIDMDAFFAAVEQRDDPGLRGRPVLVGGGDRGVVCAASYEARRFGVHSAMPMVQARRRCPGAAVVAPRHRHYAAVSRAVFAIFGRFTPAVEALSLDEAFLDVTGSRALFGDGPHIAAAIRAAVYAELGLRASAGVAPSKFVAKVASDLRKPDALVVVPPAAVEGFLRPLPIERMWGVGAVTAARLRHAGLRTLGDVAQAAPAHLRLLVGAGGERMAALARGDDRRPVICDAAAQSIGAENTFDADLRGEAALLPRLLAQTLRVAARLGATQQVAGGVTVKLKDSRHRLRTRQMALSRPAGDPDTLFEAVRALLARLAVGGAPQRLCGVAVHDLRPASGVGGGGGELFVDPERARRARLEAVRQQVGARFGAAYLTRASLLPLRR